MSLLSTKLYHLWAIRQAINKLPPRDFVFGRKLDYISFKQDKSTSRN